MLNIFRHTEANPSSSASLDPVAPIISEAPEPLLISVDQPATGIFRHPSNYLMNLLKSLPVVGYPATPTHPMLTGPSPDETTHATTTRPRLD